MVTLIKNRLGWALLQAPPHFFEKFSSYPLKFLFHLEKIWKMFLEFSLVYILLKFGLKKNLERVFWRKKNSLGGGGEKETGRVGWEFFNFFYAKNLEWENSISSI
jgi:hypothetical protein